MEMSIIYRFIDSEQHANVDGNVDFPANVNGNVPVMKHANMNGNVKNISIYRFRLETTRRLIQN